MYTRLINYLNVNNILYDYQFGFRRYHSTTLALIDVVDEIYQHLDNRDMVLGIYLDLQKAVDTVDHNILLAKLANYGIRGVLYNWFKDYLNDRKQYVCISGTNSELPNYELYVHHHRLSALKNKRPPYWKSTFGFDFDHLPEICTLFCIRQPNFVQMEATTAEI